MTRKSQNGESMRIFIDESGSFTYADDHNAWSAVGAVVILEQEMDAAESALQQFKAENGCPLNEEFKLGKVRNEMSTYLKEHYGVEVDLSGVFDIGRLIGDDIQFVDSKGDFGVQIADLLTSGLRRCLKKEFNDNLGAATFLGRLMVNRGHRRRPLLLLSLGEEAVLDKPTERLVRMMRRQQRSMIRH